MPLSKGLNTESISGAGKMSMILPSNSLALDGKFKAPRPNNDGSFPTMLRILAGGALQISCRNQDSAEKIRRHFQEARMLGNERR